jgi:hypothetical protein
MAGAGDMLPVRDRSFYLREHPLCFVGREAVAFLMATGAAADTNQALRIGNALIHEGLIRHVDDAKTFTNDYEFYRFKEHEAAKKAAGGRGGGSRRAGGGGNGRISKTDGGSLTMADFRLLRVLGRGAFGTVLLCELKPKMLAEQPTRCYAIKILRKLDMSTYTKNRTQLERQIMERVHHPFIASLKFSFQTDDKLYLGMEYLQVGREGAGGRGGG